MYRIILADDNYLIRQALKKTIPWEELELTVIAEAEDGISLKEALREYKPELLITDIRMPGLSGLEVTEYLKKLGMDTKVIIFTGYQEFQYAQQAIKLGVFDFIVKPIRDEELIRVLKKAVRKLEEEKMVQSFKEHLIEENQNYRNRIKSADRIMERQILLELAHGRQRDGGENILRGKKWFYVVARLRETEGDKSGEASVHLKELVEDYGDENICLEIRENRELEFLFFVRKEDSASMANIRLKNRLLEMAEAVRQEENIQVCFTISNLSTGFENLSAMREQAVQVMRENFFTSRERVLFAWHYNTIQLKQEGTIIHEMDRFYHFLEEAKEEEIGRRVRELLNSMERETGGDEFQIKCLASELCITLYRKFCFGKLGDKEKIQSINQILGKISELMDMGQMQEYLEEVVKWICRQKKTEHFYENPLVGKTVQYVQTYYSNPDLSLTALASVFNVNASYLSRLLKKETGMNFIDILTEERIKKAKQFLEEGKRVAQVGDLVGYKDYAYFYQVFKRVEGIAPTEYKKNKNCISTP